MAINVYLNDRDEVLNVHLNESGAKGEKGDPIKIVETTVDNEGNTVIKFNDGSTTTIKKGERGEKGDKGDGITVLGTEKNTNGDLVVKFSDGSKVTVPKGDKGEQGEVGKAGATGESAKITSQRKLDNGDTELSFNDGTKVVLPKGEKGDKGLKGDTGAKGEQGNTGEASKILSTEYDSEGNTVIKFNDGSSVTVKKGAKGDKGATGEQGKQGDKGDTGEPLKVLNTSTDNSGNTVIKFSDNSTVTVKKGDKGATGEQGIKGEKGEPFKYEDFTKEQIDSLKASFNVREVTSLSGTGDVTTLYVYEGGLYFWNGTEYKKAVDLSKKVDTSSITSDENASGADKIFSVDFIKAKLKEMGAKIDKKVGEEQGKGLSSNDYTDEDKKKVEAIPENPKYTDTTYDLTPYAKTVDLKTDLSDFTDDETHRTVTDTEKKSWSGKAEKTDIPTKLSELTNDETFKTEAEIKNLITQNAPKQDLTPYAKKTELPKNLSELANDKGYKTEAEIRTLIESSNKLKKSVVDKLPTTGKEDLIYLVKDTKGKAGNIYLEYLWINNAFELIGSTQVDLSGYAKTTDIKTKLSDMTADSTHRLVTDTEKTTWNSKAEKTDIPTKLSELENDKTFKTEAEIKTLIQTEAPKQDLSGYAKTTDLNTLVSKVDGKGLSTNDYTNAAKAKVDAIPTNPKYTDTTYDLTPYAKKSELMTESTVNSLIAKSIKLKKEVVTSLPSTGKDDVLYLKKDGNDVNNSYVEYMWINSAWEIIGNTKIDLNPYAKKTDIKTSLSQMTQSSSYRTVSDSEKTTWNNKLSTVSGQDVSRAKTKGYSSAGSWSSVGNTRDVEDWIGDFDKRTRENKEKIDGVQSMTTSEVEAVLNEVFR